MNLSKNFNQKLATFIFLLAFNRNGHVYFISLHQVITCVSAGYRHSACVTAEGQLFTWGEGDYGRLGLGDNTSRNTPVLVKEISNAGTVSYYTKTSYT